MKTYEDLEREAYICGNTELAKIYAKCIELSNHEEEVSALFDLERDQLEDEIEYWKNRAIKAETLLEKQSKRN